MTSPVKTRVLLGDWQSQAERLFGKEPMAWRFVCPSCKTAWAVADWKAASAPEGAVAFSCVGRWLAHAKDAFTGKGPCNYAGGGLIGINPIVVVHPDGREQAVFEFADPEAPRRRVNA